MYVFAAILSSVYLLIGLIGTHSIEYMPPGRYPGIQLKASLFIKIVLLFIALSAPIPIDCYSVILESRNNVKLATGLKLKLQTRLLSLF